jgi:hypothetical protein
MERNEFIKKMLVLGSELANTDDKLQISMIVNDAELLTKKYESELKKLRVTDVSGRSEQLVSFLQWYIKDEAKRDEPNRIVNIVERYLNETNCH